MAEIATVARRFWIDEEGATMAEYAVLLGLIALAVVLAIDGLRTAIGGRFDEAATHLGESES